MYLTPFMYDPSAPLNYGEERFSAIIDHRGGETWSGIWRKPYRFSQGFELKGKQKIRLIMFPFFSWNLKYQKLDHVFVGSYYIWIFIEYFFLFNLYHLPKGTVEIPSFFCRWLCQEGDLGDFPPGALALMCLSDGEIVDVEMSIMGITRWWFQILFYFHPYLGKIPILAI